jgi:hypothetical protein
MAGLAQHAAAECGLGSLTLLTSGKGGDDGQSATSFFAAAARRLRRRGGPSGGTASSRARALVVVSLQCRTATRLCRQRIGAEAFFGDLVGFASGLLVVLAAVFFFTLTGFRGGAFDALGFLATAPCAGLFLGALALLVFA